MSVSKDDVARQFDKMSHAYMKSKGHARGEDLAIVIGMLQPAKLMRVLDVATGAGHTAVGISPYVKEVVAVDLAPEMIERTKELAASGGVRNLVAVVMDAEDLKFPRRSFDAVTCRIAPHHFLDVRKAIDEIARVLKEGGILVVEDSCAPEDRVLDSFINNLEKLRDSTHVRSYTEAQWRSLLTESGFQIQNVIIYRKHHSIDSWLERSGLDSSGKQRVYDAFLLAPESAKKYFEIKYDDTMATSYTDDKVIIRADRTI